MSFSLGDIGKAFAQSLGGGSRGALQTESGFAFEYSKMRNSINAKVGSAIGKLGNFGLADALGIGAAKAEGLANAQETGLLAKLGATPGKIALAVAAVAAVVALGVYAWRKR